MREALLVRTFAELADTLVEDFDVVELLVLLADRCVEVLDVTAAGIMLANADGELRVVASSSEAMRDLELLELQVSEGPCPDTFRSGQAVSEPQLTAASARWPQFAPRALEAGYRSAHALPMRLRGLTIGGLNLFRAEEGLLSPDDALVGQTFADVATIAILQHRAAVEAQELNDQLAHALNSRVLIEQAKGMVAERTGLEMGQAFEILRKHARRTSTRLLDVAGAVIDGSLPASALEQ